jgi:hypothetical protein
MEGALLKTKEVFKMAEPEQTLYNTPASGLSAARQEKSTADKAAYECVELPDEPSRYGGRQRIVTVKVGDLPLELRYKFEDSFRRGGDSVVKTMKHFSAACHGAGVFDDGTVKNLKDLTKEVEAAAGYQEKKVVLEKRVYPFLRGITIKTVIKRRA